MSDTISTTATYRQARKGLIANCIREAPIRRAPPVVTAPVMPMARGIQAAFTSDAPLLLNASSASDVTLAAMYQRKWRGDMQAPPFARREKAQETIARIVSRLRDQVPVALLADEQHCAGRMATAYSARLRIPRSSAAPLTLRPARENHPAWREIIRSVPMPEGQMAWVHEMDGHRGHIDVELPAVIRRRPSRASTSSRHAYDESAI